MMTMILSLLFTSLTYASGVDYENFRNKALDCLKSAEPAKCVEVYLEKDFIIKHNYLSSVGSHSLTQLMTGLEKSKKVAPLSGETNYFVLIHHFRDCLESKPTFRGGDAVKTTGFAEQDICTIKKQKNGQWLLSSILQVNFLSFADEKENIKTYPYEEFIGHLKMTTIISPYPTKLKLSCQNDWAPPSNPQEKEKGIPVEDYNKANNWLAQAGLDEENGETTWEIKSPKLKPGKTRVTCVISGDKNFWAQRFFTIIYEPNLRKSRD